MIKESIEPWSEAVYHELIDIHGTYKVGIALDKFCVVCNLIIPNYCESEFQSINQINESAGEGSSQLVGKFHQICDPLSLGIFFFIG